MKIKIALLADLHLPFIESASQYKALEFAVDSINRNMPDVVVGLGDMTACGDINAAEYFLNEMRKIDLPKTFYTWKFRYQDKREYRQNKDFTIRTGIKS